MSDTRIKFEIENSENIKENHISWDEYFMGVAILSALRSKDPNTKVGACIVGLDHKIKTTGYNGMPSGIDETKISWNRESEDPLNTKYPYVCHAELNAILNATTPLKDCILYVTLFPCNECAKAVIQSGIKKVVYLDDKYHDVNYSVASRKLLTMARVEMLRYEGEIPTVSFSSIRFMPNKK